MLKAKAGARAPLAPAIHLPGQVSGEGNRQFLESLKVPGEKKRHNRVEGCGRTPIPLPSLRLGLPAGKS